MILQYRFIEFAPDVLEEGVIYISIEYSSAVHKCVCGCGNLVVTPFSPTDWKLIFDGKSISLYPSIGNWNFECKSHYWIDKSEVVFARIWNDEEIEEGREKDLIMKKEYFSNRKKRGN